MDFDAVFRLSPVFAALIPLNIALVQVFKAYLGEYWAPLLSVALGLILAVIATDTTITQTILAGLVVGTSAAGFYSGVKSMVK